MAFCIPKHLVDKFLEKLKSGEIEPAKLSAMTSAERNTFFSSFLGNTNATKVNSIFESKLLLKNQQQGIINWAKQVSGMKPEVKRDLLSRVERMDKILQPKDMDSFLSDLASQRLGVDVTMEEAGKISELAKNVSEKKALINEASPIRSDDRLAYGNALMAFKNYTGDLKAEAKKLTPIELLKNPMEIVQQLGGLTKSILASMDNSFFGRQGLVTLITKPKIWADNFKKSFGDMGKELKGIDAITPIKSDIYSRPNALNGKYKAMRLDIGIESEEAFPSQLPEKIPLLGKLYKASESAYNGAALRIRADLADRLITEAESMGVDVKDKNTGLGILINSMTGRGAAHMTPSQSKFINATVFSIRYLKSNLDILTAHVFDPKVSPFIKKKAAQNLIKLIGVIGGILGTAKLLDPESVEGDPRSSNFGKVMVGKNHEIKINISGGFASIITLASRITPTMRNGKWGFWTKDRKGEYRQIGKGKFGDRDPSELIVDFMKGKVAPIARLLLDMWKGEGFGGEELTIPRTIKNLFTPLPISNIFDLTKTSAGTNPLLFSILSALDLLGVNVNERYYNIPQEEIEDYQTISKQLKEQNKANFELNQNAEIVWNKMKQMPLENRKKLYIELKRRSPAVMKKVKELAKGEEINLKYTERLIKQLNPSNRSKYLWNKISEMKTSEERKQYYKEMRDKKIITDEVARQIKIRAAKER